MLFNPKLLADIGQSVIGEFFPIIRLKDFWTPMFKYELLKDSICFCCGFSLSGIAFTIGQLVRWSTIPKMIVYVSHPVCTNIRRLFSPKQNNF